MIETRDDKRIFAGSDQAHTATVAVDLSEPTPALTPLMIEPLSGAMVIWDGEYAGQAVALLALDHDGKSGRATAYKSGTFDINVILWPDDADAVKKLNAFAGSAISVA